MYNYKKEDKEDIAFNVVHFLEERIREAQH